MFVAAEEFTTPAEARRRYLELRVLLSDAGEHEAACYNLRMEALAQEGTALEGMGTGTAPMACTSLVGVHNLRGDDMDQHGHGSRGGSGSLPLSPGGDDLLDR